MAQTPDQAPEAASPAPDKPVSAKAAQKVELDLDDAPFLEDEEPEDKKPEAPKEAIKDAPEALPEPPARLTLKDRLLAQKKRLIIAAASLALLAVAGVGARIYLKKPPPPPEVAVKTIVVPDKPPPLPAAPAPKYQLAWESFWVEQKDTEGAVRFLVCKFTVPTDNAQLFAEMQAKKVALRDALFYYLRNRPFTLFSDQQKVGQLKRDLMTVINEHVASGKIEDIFIENYLVK